nr:UPF0149 family protein [Stagnihabitans tardus]
MESPPAEKKGEFNSYLKGSGISLDWVEGYLTFIVITPKMLQPNLWLPQVLAATSAPLTQTEFLRFIELVMMRAQAISDMASSAQDFAAALAARSTKKKQDWLAGLATAASEFKSAWPKKGMKPEDIRLLTLAGREALTPDEWAELAPLIAFRQSRNRD